MRDGKRGVTTTRQPARRGPSGLRGVSTFDPRMFRSSSLEGLLRKPGDVAQGTGPRCARRSDPRRSARPNARRTGIVRQRRRRPSSGRPSGSGRTYGRASELACSKSASRWPSLRAQPSTRPIQTAFYVDTAGAGDAHVGSTAVRRVRPGPVVRIVSVPRVQTRQPDDASGAVPDEHASAATATARWAAHPAIGEIDRWLNVGDRQRAGGLLRFRSATADQDGDAHTCACKQAI